MAVAAKAVQSKNWYLKPKGIMPAKRMLGSTCTTSYVREMDIGQCIQDSSGRERAQLFSLHCSCWNNRNDFRRMVNDMFLTQMNTSAAGTTQERATHDASSPAPSTTPFGEFCYLAFVAIFSGLKSLGFYEGQTIFTIGLVIACLFLLVKITLTRHTIPEYLIIAAFLGMGLLVYHNTGEKSLLINLMVIIGIKGVSTRKAIQTCLAFWGCGYVLLTFLSLVGLHDDALLLASKWPFGYIIRHALGQTHQNVLHTSYFAICAMILYLAADRFTKRQKLALIGILMAVNVYIFSYSVSYTGMISCCFLYAAYLYVTFRGRLNLFEKTLAALILPVCILYTLVGPLISLDKMAILRNSSLLGTVYSRYSLTNYFLTEQPITLFGTDMSLTDFHLTLDFSYAYLFSRLGIIPFILLIGMYLILVHHLMKENRLAELAVVLAHIIGGASEPFLFNLGFKNMTLFFLAELLYELTGRLPGKEYCIAGLIRKDPETICSAAEGRTVRITGKRTEPDNPEIQSATGGFAVRITGLGPAGCRVGGRILKTWMRGWKRYLLIAASAFLIAAGITALIRKPSEKLYINITLYNYWKDNGAETTFLSEEDVRQIRSDGDLVYSYADEETLMYIYDGSVVDYENIRIILSAGAWFAVIICTCAAALSEYRRTTGSSGAAEGNPSVKTTIVSE